MVYQFFEEVEIEAAEKIKPNPSINKLIKTLRDMNLKLGLVTNNGRVGVMKSLEKMELVDAF
ncbi:MAG: HAD hydrolase-like protein, partial [Nitrososphaerales archaeon]